MKSIRRHLLVWLLPGFVLLWLGAGMAIFLSVKQGLEARLDSDLRDVADVIPFGADSGGGNILSFREIAESDLGVYFQIWMADGSRLLKSESLGRFELVPPDRVTRKGKFGEQILENGEALRTYVFRVEDTRGLGKLDIMVAKSRDELTRSLWRSAAAIGVVGGVAVIAFVLLLAAALRSGLGPLMAVGDQASKIDVNLIGDRFPETNLPSELNPIVEKLNDLLARIEASLLREKRFSSDLAHELRSPVAALKTIAEVALKWPEQASPEDYENIREISEELQVTIENMLTLARLEKEPARVTTETVRLLPVVEECWAAVEEVANRRRVGIDLRIQESETVETDPGLLRVIVSNLCSNASGYSPEESLVIVESGCKETVLTFSNPAPELSENELPLLFHRLWRRDQSRTDLKHSGLGLSLARACADALGLQLDAGLDAEKTLTFRLWKKS